MNFPPPSERQARIIWMGLSGLAIAALLGVVVLFIWGLDRVLDVLSPVLWPLAVAGVVAYLLDPVVDFFERKRLLSRAWAIVSVFAVALLLVAGVMAIIVPPIVAQTRDFANRLPAIYQKAETHVEKWLDNPPEWFQKLFKEEAKPSEPPPPAAAPTNNVPPSGETNAVAPAAAPAPTQPVGSGLKTPISSTLESAATWLPGFVGKALSSVVSWFGVLVGLALVPIYGFYLLLEKQGIQSKWTNYLPIKDSKLKDEMVFILSSINDYLIAFFRGQVLVALCDGILYGLGFLAIRLPYAILLGAVAAVITIVPLIGAIIIFVTAMIIALVQFGDWQHPLLVLLVFAIVQTLEALVVSPRIMKGRVGLHPLTIIIAVMVGTTLLGGLLGGVLAIPLTAVLRVLMERYVWKRPASREAS